MLGLTLSQARVDAHRRLRLTDDLTSVRSYLGGGAVSPILDAPWAPAFILIIALMNVWMGLFALASAIVLFALAVLNDRLSRALLREAAGQQNTASEFAASAVANADVIHAMGMQDAVARRYHVSVDAMTKASQAAADRSSLLAAISKAIRIGVQVGIMALGAYLVTQAQLSSGGMIAASIILGRALAPIEQSISSWRMFVQARDGYERIRAFLKTVPESTDRIALPEYQAVGSTSRASSYRIKDTRQRGAAAGRLLARSGHGAGADRTLGLGQEHALPAHRRLVVAEYRYRAARRRRCHRPSA